jgi:hypothetical protein
MRMRQSLAQLERSFEQEAARERAHRRELRRTTATRSRVRRKARVEQLQKLRFTILLVMIALTVVVVTVAMFETLAWLIG